MKRTHARYKAKAGALIAFCIPDLPSIASLRKLLDISKGGLAFRYVATEKQQLACSEVDLFCDKCLTAPVLGSLPCTVVYDRQEHLDLTYAYYAQARRCGLKFENLSEEQEAGLEDFIGKYTEKANSPG